MQDVVIEFISIISLRITVFKVLPHYISDIFLDNFNISVLTRNLFFLVRDNVLHEFNVSMYSNYTCLVTFTHF